MQFCYLQALLDRQPVAPQIQSAEPIKIISCQMFREVERPSLNPHFWEDKDSCTCSKLCTQITANLESISFDVHDKMDQFKDKDNCFFKRVEESTSPILETQIREQEQRQDSIYSKFQELQERSSKIINMFPQFHSRSLQGSAVQSQNDGIGLNSSNQINSKLKIIKDLQFKIFQLQSNIRNPNIGEEEMRTIEKEINLDFQNYYTEAQEKEQKDEGLNEEIFGQEMKSNQEQKIQNSLPILKTTDNFNFFRPIYSSYDACILIPKVIEIEVPIPVVKIISVPQQEQFQTNPEAEKQLRRSKSYSDKNKSNSNSSIGRIINQFSKNIPLDHLVVKEIHQYQLNEPQILVSMHESQSDQSSGFHLPIDSFEKIDRSDHEERVSKLKPTDRSNISSMSELDKIRDEIWNRECIEFNQEHLNQVKESQGKSVYNEQHFQSDEQNQQGSIAKVNLSKDIISLKQEVIRLREELKVKNTELSHLIEASQEYEAKAIEKEIELLQILEKQEAQELQHEELFQKINQYKEEICSQQQAQESLKNKIGSLEKELIAASEEKECDNLYFTKFMQEKQEEIEEILKNNLELKNTMAKREEQFESQVQEMEAQLAAQKEQLKYYKIRIEEDGFNINLEEASLIRDLIEGKEDAEIAELHRKYKEAIQCLTIEKEQSQRCIQELVEENKKLSQRFIHLGQEYNLFEQKFKNHLQGQVQSQRQIDQILAQSKVSSKSEIQVPPSCDEQVKAIDSVISNLLSESERSERSLHFVYAVGRVLHRLKFCQANLERERQERERLTNKLKGLNLSVSKELQKAEERTDKLRKENIKFRQQTHELSAALRKVESKLNHARIQFIDSSKLAASAHEAQKKMLELQNRKVQEKLKKIKIYSQELEQQLDKQSSESAVASECKFSQLSSNKQSSQIKSAHYSLTSSVISFSAKPCKIMLPKRITAPLPPIPSSIAPLPSQITLDKLLQRRGWWTPEIRLKFALKLVDLCSQLIRVSRKLFSLKPCQIVVSGLQGNFEIVVRQEFGNTNNEDESSLLYRAPEVLLGFSQSEASYAWFIGVMLDQIWHQKLFFKKISQILSRKDNFEVRNSEIEIKELLLRMLKKNQKERPTLEQVKEELLASH